MTTAMKLPSGSKLSKDQFLKLCINYKEQKKVDKQLNDMVTEGYFQDKHVRLNKYVNKW